MSKLKKIIISFLFAIFVGLVGNAQEFNLPQQNQYSADNEFIISPTFAGMGDYMKIRLSGFSQWVGIKGAPDVQTLSGDLRVGQRSGAGFLVYNDKNGNTRQIGAKLSFAHSLILDTYDKHFLTFGISYSLNHFRLDIQKIKESSNDPGITDDRRTTNHNFELGILYRYKGVFLNFHVSNILNKLGDRFAINEPRTLRNYNLYAGYRYRKTRDAKWEFEPSIFFQMFESDFRSSTDINFKVRYHDFEDYYWAGINYRFLNDQIFRPLSVAPMIGLKKYMFYFAYSYQISLNELIFQNTGTHMLTLGIDLFQGISNCPCMARTTSGH